MENLSRLKTPILLVTLITSGLAYAHSGAQGVVKKRMDIMSDIGKNMKIIGTMVKSGEFDTQALSQAALTIKGHATQTADIFPEGSIESPSEALPAIWTNWDEFIAIADKLEVDAGKLAELANSATDTNTIKTQFQFVAQSCSGCHEKFRLKK